MIGRATLLPIIAYKKATSREVAFFILNSKQGLGIVRRQGNGFLIGKTKQARKRHKSVTNEPRMIDPSAKRNGRKIGGIGFHKNTIVRHALRDLKGFPRIFEGQHPRKGDIPATANQLTRHLRTAAEAMEDTAHVRVAKHRFKAIAVSVAIVDNDGQLPFLSHYKLRFKKGSLPFLIRVLDVIIKPDFTKRDDLVPFARIGRAEKLGKSGKLVVKRSKTVMHVLGMKANGSIHIRIFRRLRHTDSAIFVAGSDVNHTRNALTEHLIFQDGIRPCRFFGKATVKIMRVGIKNSLSRQKRKIVIHHL